VKKRLLLLAAALLLTLPAACMHRHHGPGGPGGPMHRDCGCKCCQQMQQGQKPDCPQKDCPQKAGCPKAQGQQAPEAAPAK